MCASMLQGWGYSCAAKQQVQGRWEPDFTPSLETPAHIYMMKPGLPMEGKAIQISLYIL